MLLSVFTFFDHVRRVHPIDSKLNGYEISSLLYHLKKLKGHKTTAIHRQRHSQPKAKVCKDCAALSLRVKRLEKTVKKILAEKTSIRKPPPRCKTPTSKTKRADVRHSVIDEAHTHLPSFEGTYCRKFFNIGWMLSSN